MNKSKLLILIEGKDPDKQIIRHIMEEFQIKGEIIWVNMGTVYTFYKKLKEEYDEYTDIGSYIRTKYRAQISEPFKNEEISEIYLFFDYDIHSELNENYNDIEKINRKIELIEEISLFFNDETDRGKLYLSFPMVEAYNKPIGSNFQYEKDSFSEKLEEFVNFKKKIKREIGNRGKIYINSKYKEIIKFYINHSMELVNLDAKDIERMKILNYQNNLIKKEQKINIYSAFPIFLKEYFGLEKLDIYLENMYLQTFQFLLSSFLVHVLLKTASVIFV